MLFKTKRISGLVTAIVLLILFSNIAVGTLIETKNSSENSGLSTELTIVDHKITAEEIQNLKNLISSNTETLTQAVDSHGTGFSASTLEDIDEIAENAYVIDTIYYAETNSSVDNSATPWFPPIGNQDGEGSCVAWAVGYYVKTFQEAKEHNWDLSGANWEGGTYGHPTTSYQDKIMSPEFVYALINKGIDDGASFEISINLVSSIGVCSWAQMSYDPFDSASWPSEAAWTEAAYYRSSNSPTYEYVFVNNDENVLSLKNWLAAGNLAVFALDAGQYDFLTSQDVLTSYDSRQEPNHANTIVGYDDNFSYTINGVEHFGAFKIANSWGKGGWENVADGCYWIPYEIMKQIVTHENPVVIFNDLIDYQPQLTASFQITHNLRGECAIIIGYGTTSQPLATKIFSNTVLGGNQPFCSNNIVVDITEFKQSMTSFYNQTFFLTVYDNATRTTGTITYFAVSDSVSTDTPLQTKNLRTVSLSVTCNVATPTLTVTPDTGIAGDAITLCGTDFNANDTVDLSYLNPVTGAWVTIAEGIPVSQSNNFSYTIAAPDLNIGNAAGDNPQSSDSILFSALESSSGVSFNSENTFTEYRKGLTTVNSVEAAGLFGNNTDFSGSVLVEAGKGLNVCGINFNQGTLTAVYDGTYDIGSTVVNADGSFNATFTIPIQALQGQHVITLGGVGGNFMFTVTQLPKIVADYDDSWKKVDFSAPLSVEGTGVSEIYYKINSGETKTVSADGQPQFTTEGANNNLEYWGIWSNGENTIELTHRTLSGIKLDKTAPSGSIKINEDIEFTTSTTVNVTITAQDVLSGVQKIRFSNDRVWDSESWETYKTSKSWTLTLEDGEKTVYCQIMDYAGVTASFEDSIILDSTAPIIEVGGDRESVVGLDLDFVANCSDQNEIESIVWSFGDNSTEAIGYQIIHAYDTVGNYTVTVSVKDNAGNMEEARINVNVKEENTGLLDNPLMQIPIQTSSAIAVLFAGVGLTFIVIKYKQKIARKS